MKEEASISIRRRTGTLALAAMMAAAVFSPAPAFAEELSPQEEDAQVQTKAAAVSVASVKLNKKNVSVKAGTSMKLQVAVAPAAAKNKTAAWKSSNASVASVNSAGTVTAKAPGKAIITVTADGKTDTCSIAVSLAAPERIRTKSTGIRSVKVSWKKVAGASRYEIYRSKKKTGSYKKIATVKGKTSYRDRKASTGKTYYYKVKARSGSYRSAFSSRVRAKARPAATSVTAKAGEESVRLSWKKVKGAHGYHIYHTSGNSKKGFKRIKVVKKGTSTRFTHTDRKAGKQQHYKVKAYRIVNGKKVFAASSSAATAKPKKVQLKESKKGFQYKKKFTVKTYAYTGGGRTAMGTRARVGAIAVDPDVIPLGTKVYVEGYGYARAEDTGGNIKGKTVDLYMNSTGACMQWGVRYKTIYVDVRK